MDYRRRAERRLGYATAVAVALSAVTLGGRLVPAVLGEQGAWNALGAGAVLSTHAAQIYFLGTISRHPGRRRLRTWGASLLAQAAAFLVDYAMFGGSVIYGLLANVVSVSLHVAGAAFASNGQA